MKKLLILSAIILAVTLKMCGGDDNDNNNDKEIEKLKGQYTEACGDHDFDKARSITTKLEAIHPLEAGVLIKDVNDKEIYYLLAKPSQDNDNRILYLYNTYEEYQLPVMTDVLQVAVSMDNKNLPIKLFKAGVKPNVQNVNSALEHGMDDFVMDVLLSQPNLLSDNKLFNYYVERNGPEATTTFILKHTSLFTPQGLIKIGMELDNVETVAKAITMDYSLMNNKEFLEFSKKHPQMLADIGDHLRTQINDIKRSTPTFHSQRVVDYWDGVHYSEGGYLDSDQKKCKMPSENAAISNYNNKLRDVVSSALQINRKDIALEAIKAMLPTIEVYKGDSDGGLIHGYKVDGNHCLIYHNYDEIKRLRSDLK